MILWPFVFGRSNTLRLQAKNPDRRIYQTQLWLV